MYLSLLQLLILLITIDIPAVNSLNVPKSPTIIQLQAVASSQALALSSGSSEGSNITLNASVPTIVCSGETQEPILIPDQCMEALVNSDFARISPSDMMTFAHRFLPSQTRTIGLPRRYLSSDGRCAIEPHLRFGAWRAHNTARNFNLATNRIIKACVDLAAHKGGIASNTGGDDNLEIKLFEFIPKVQCYGTVDRQRMVSSCNNLANEMNTSSQWMLFSAAKSLAADLYLPYGEFDPNGGGCGFGISIASKSGVALQHSSWYTIWQAVVAINAMCVRKGQMGRWLSIGSGIYTPGYTDVVVGDAQAAKDFTAFV